MLVSQSSCYRGFVPPVSKLRPGFGSYPSFVIFSDFDSLSRLRVKIIGFLFIRFSGDLEVTVNFLTEIDQLVQLIESPIFACKNGIFVTIIEY